MIYIIIMIIIFLILVSIGILSERKAYNKGICRICGNKLQYFDTDSQGGRGYACQNNHYVWISYPLIDKERR